MHKQIFSNTTFDINLNFAINYYPQKGNNMGINAAQTVASWSPKWASLSDAHNDFLDFLRSTKLLYSIRGFEHSTDLENPPIAFENDDDGHPMMLVEGKWTRWDEIQDLGLRYDEQSRLLLDHDGIEWNYLPDQGLTKIARYNNLYPIGRLNAAAMRALDNSVSKTVAERNHRNYIQIITDGNSPASRTNHIAIRLISRTGDIYSPGFETITPLQFSLCQFPKFLASQNVHISSQDFREFKKFDERPTTTIPISDENFDAALTRLRELTQTPLRLNVMGPNCVSFAAEIMGAAGVEIDIYQYPYEMGYGLLPSLSKIPYLGCLISMVKRCVLSLFNLLHACTPAPIETIIRWTFQVITYIPAKILTVLRNILMLSLGAARQVDEAVNPDDTIAPNAKVGNFSARITCWWKDIWRDDIGLIASPIKLVDWQDRQMKDYTHIQKYDGSPRLAIVPPKPELRVLRADP